MVETYENDLESGRHNLTRMVKVKHGDLRVVGCACV